MGHFNWTQFIPGVGHHYIHVATAAVVALLLLFVGFLAKAALGKGSSDGRPSSEFSLKGIFELVTEFIVGIGDMVMGTEHRNKVPMFAAIFLFIFFNNLIGLIPGMTAATDNLNTTLALGLFAFVVYNIYGFREHGMAYLKTLMAGMTSGPMILLGLILFCVELISHLVRPFSLGLRLMGNMAGDHTVLGIFLDLVPIGVPVFFLGLGLFVCFMQAFIFTLLGMIYVSMATSHDH
jgi:F-type H+-transporting ATPase subunit a